MRRTVKSYVIGAAALLLGIGAFCAFSPAPENAKPTEQVDAGKFYYTNICASCHGDDGKGDGPTAAYLRVKPRDFTRAQFKFRSTASGQLPLDEDLFETISGGLPGTAMPPFGDMKPEIIADIIMYVKTFSPRWTDPNEFPLDTIVAGAPVPFSDASVRRGRLVYIQAKCWECHGMQGKGDGPSVNNQFDDKGNKLITPDLTQSWDKKVGFTPELAYKILTAGENGTTMPSYQSAFSDQQRWDLANYVIALGQSRKPFDFQTTAVKQE